ncbi:UDP-glucose,sterol transferase [Colletotrichum kahawae]|uniref:UDP-glucose,sterol transferase n=1 Tax=Colletotrichum kahawae TaxID=34407 RepID=A0AAD9YTB0_COLKA|nr:UDP-glucose,sterol transferase [Colletotrichum kahawae]
MMPYPDSWGRQILSHNSYVILDAVRSAGVRAIVSKGWSDLGGSGNQSIYWIGDCPHEWLFQHVAAAVHHGGAGTTACGLRNGKPTTIVPFLGDQPFWGDMVANAGAGPKPIPHKQLSPENLAAAIRHCLSPQAVAGAQRIAAQMEAEDGVQAAVDSWWRQLPLERMQCDLIPSKPAVWRYTKYKRPMKLSKAAAEVLMSHDAVQIKQLTMHQTKPITIEVTRWDSISGGAFPVLATAVDMTGSITGWVTKPIEAFHDEKRRRARELRRHEANGGSALDGKVAGASAKSIGMIAPNAAEGMLVDIPLAITEGMRSVPKHFGTKIRDHGPVTDAKSGAVVAGKTFAFGFVNGLSDVVMEPLKGAEKQGAVGALKGFGKGAASLVAKSGAGMFGLFAYPSAGIDKSLRSTVHTGTGREIAQERHAEGQ